MGELVEELVERMAGVVHGKEIHFLEDWPSPEGQVQATAPTGTLQTACPRPTPRVGVHVFVMALPPAAEHRGLAVLEDIRLALPVLELGALFQARRMADLVKELVELGASEKAYVLEEGATVGAQVQTGAQIESVEGACLEAAQLGVQAVATPLLLGLAQEIPPQTLQRRQMVP